MKDYSFKDMVLLVNGRQIGTNVPDADDAINIVPVEDTFTVSYACDTGEMLVVQSAVEGQTATVKLSQLSDDNAFLNAVFELQKQRIFPVLESFNLRTGESVSATNTVIAKKPDYTRGKNLATEEWVFQLERLT